MHPLDPPAAGGIPLIGRLPAMIKNPLEALTAAARYGDVVRLSRYPLRSYLVNHPDAIREVFVTRSRNFAQGPAHKVLRDVLGNGVVTSEGEARQRHRRLLQPAFHKRHLPSVGRITVELARRQIAGWRDGREIDLCREMAELTFGLTVKTLAGSEVEQDVCELRQAMAVVQRHVLRRYLNPFGQLLSKVPLPRNLEFRRAIARVDRLVYGLIEDLGRSPAAAGAFLSELSRARDANGEPTMSKRQIRDHAVTILAAGHESMALAMTWTCYLLAQDPRVEAKLQAELGVVLQGRPATVDDLPALGYLRQVVKESLRLYPPAYALARRAVSDVNVGPYRIPAGSMVCGSQFLVHRDPRWFSDPTAFRPERWTREFEASLPRCAYFPFGAGQRRCAGERVALAEVGLMLATMAQRFELRLAPGQVVAPKALVTLQPAHGMRMVVHARRPVAQREARDATTAILSRGMRS